MNFHLFADLPVDIRRRYLYRHLPVQTFIQLCQTCKEYYILRRDPRIWEYLFERDLQLSINLKEVNNRYYLPLYQTMSRVPAGRRQIMVGVYIQTFEMVGRLCPGYTLMGKYTGIIPNVVNNYADVIIYVRLSESNHLRFIFYSDNELEIEYWIDKTCSWALNTSKRVLEERFPDNITHSGIVKYLYNAAGNHHLYLFESSGSIVICDRDVTVSVLSQ